LNLLENTFLLNKIQSTKNFNCWEKNRKCCL